MRELAYSLDPALWAEEVLGFVPDPWQAEVLRSASSRVLMNCSRQSGKSSVSAILALWTSLYQPRSLTLMVSPSLRQSSEIFRKVVAYMEMLDPVPVKAEDTKLSIKMGNGARVVSLPGSESTIRGYSAVDLLIVDEAARVGDDLYFAIKPMLAVSQGRLLALSTPWGRRGWFYAEWAEGEGWQRHEITADQCPRISRDFLESEKRSMPRSWFRSEYFCEFVEPIDAVFGYDDVMRAVSDKVEPLEV
ncbi:terminase large subunit domain-containing protein [Candidatus Methanocrinis natronophilus]|uniref:Terminase family protein n=1 Tax=Candidatus Methanocrinis natronophilus TaxID=3033396 RepID=A0ABT5XB39_9EURY|nr:terminase family protein [Candidatus Methanocrinis natronophilus]MDF0591895.1 terminase family protein [Candidatus Methanocrinis natronophilus]